MTPSLVWMKKCSGKSAALAEAQAAGVSAARRDVFLDNQDDYEYIRGQLTSAARRARAR